MLRVSSYCALYWASQAPKRELPALLRLGFRSFESAPRNSGTATGSGSIERRSTRVDATTAEGTSPVTAPEPDDVHG